MPSRRDDPFREIERIFDRMSSELGGSPFAAAAGSVAVDVEDREDAFVVTADVPGFEKDDIDVTLADRTLRIRAEREEATEESEGDYLRRERHAESVERSVTLPSAVEEEGISATYSNGVLTVTLPKRSDEGGQRIEVE